MKFLNSVLIFLLVFAITYCKEKEETSTSITKTEAPKEGAQPFAVSRTFSLS